MKTSSILSAALIAVTASGLLSGCVGLAVGAGATAGVAAAQEGGIPTAASDAAIRLNIADAWFKKDTQMFSKLSMTVKEGRVLITGSVPSPDQRVEAIKLAWQVNGVRQVINEIRVDNGDGFKGYMTDTWVTTNLKSRILLDKYIQSINYTIETVGGVVYLMGVSQDQKELERVIDYARNTKYVQNVVSYVRMRGEPIPGVPVDSGSNASSVQKTTTTTSTNKTPSYTTSQSVPDGAAAGGVPSVEAVPLR